jgi:hypothetical protein
MSHVVSPTTSAPRLGSARVPAFLSLHLEQNWSFLWLERTAEFNTPTSNALARSVILRRSPHRTTLFVGVTRYHAVKT